MQISKKRLKQIIKEELIRLAEFQASDGNSVVSKIQEIENILQELSPEQRNAVLTTLATPQK